jgi:hypothetical protein
MNAKAASGDIHRQAVMLVAPVEVIQAIQGAAASSDMLWGNPKPMVGSLSPLDDPLGSVPIDQICHTVTVVFQTGTAGIAFAAALVKFVREMNKSAELRDVRSGKTISHVEPNTTSKEVSDAIVK